MTLTKFYKLAQPDGWDFRTGQTINYRENIGKAVRVPRFDFPDEKRALCTDTVLHASRTAIDALQYAKIPCSIYCVQGNPIVRDTDKFGFKELKVLEEVPPTEFDELLGFRYQEVLHPFDPRTIGRKEVGRGSSKSSERGPQSGTQSGPQSGPQSGTQSGPQSGTQSGPQSGPQKLPTSAVSSSASRSGSTRRS